MQSKRLYHPSVSRSSDSSLRISFGTDITRELHSRVAAFCREVSSRKITGVQNVHPSYNAVLLSFDPIIISAQKLLHHVYTIFHDIEHSATTVQPRKEIPVCYGKEFGPDLDDVLAYTGLTIEEVVRIHTSVEYLVYFLGFSPGFPYLGEMPQQLFVPRLSSPRLKVPAGSVAIGGSQTGIYPCSSPGGWRIIGRTPLPLFNPEHTPPTFLEMGDLVTFRPISKDEFLVLQQHSQ
ncbi:MAG: 5-oxoprolinase subunit PxpB [bacterium]